MYTPCRRACHVPQLVDGDIISRVPLNGSSFHHDINIGSGGFFSSQSVQDGNFHTNRVSVDAQETSPLQNGLWDSTSSSDTFAFDDNTNGFLNFSLSSGYALPTSTRPIVSQDPFEDYETAVDTMLVFNTYVTPNQALATQSAGSDGWADDNVWTGSLATPSQGHFPQQLRGDIFPNRLFMTFAKTLYGIQTNQSTTLIVMPWCVITRMNACPARNQILKVLRCLLRYQCSIVPQTHLGLIQEVLPPMSANGSKLGQHWI